MNGQTQSSPVLAPAGTTAPLTQFPRPDFWVDTCREVPQMHTHSLDVMRLYQQFGCRFLPPTSTQAESILSALDVAMPGWERQHPELFYQALELNFPELVRQTHIAN